MDPFTYYTVENLVGVEIKDIDSYHSKNLILNFLDNRGAIYVGGYALALFLGNPEYPETIKTKFSDIDIIHKDPSRTGELIAAVKDSFSIVKEHVTARATSLWIKLDDQEYMLQFVTSWKGTIEEILTRFDYNNSKVCYDPLFGFTVYEYLDSLFDEGILELSPHWDDNSPPNSLALSIPRAKKYCERWDLKLDDYSLRKLTGLWLSMDENERWNSGVLADSGRAVIAIDPTAPSPGHILRDLFADSDLEPPEELFPEASSETTPFPLF